MENNIKKLSFTLFSLFLIPTIALAENDPFTKAGTGMMSILFGGLGVAICTIIIGSTFLMAKVGKITWDKFMQVMFCTAGFLGAPSIVMLIKTWVG